MDIQTTHCQNNCCRIDFTYDADDQGCPEYCADCQAREDKYQAARERQREREEDGEVNARFYRAYYAFHMRQR